jgi:hypothetical protein
MTYICIFWGPVQIIENLRKNLKENYNVYMVQMTLNNYLLSY